jgi:hypothetical protein
MGVTGVTSIVINANDDKALIAYNTYITDTYFHFLNLATGAVLKSFYLFYVAYDIQD